MPCGQRNSTARKGHGTGRLPRSPTGGLGTSLSLAGRSLSSSVSASAPPEGPCCSRQEGGLHVHLPFPSGKGCPAPAPPCIDSTKARTGLRVPSGFPPNRCAVPHAPAAVSLETGSHHLVSKEQDGFETELPGAEVEEVFQAGPQQLHHHDVVVPLRAAPPDGGDAHCGRHETPRHGRLPS